MEEKLVYPLNPEKLNGQKYEENISSRLYSSSGKHCMKHKKRYAVYKNNGF